ncbi:MAG TPA: hypothetical protein VL173_10990 [Vicinamibacterales bacterium]|nr:hypothetical protein [Vicinamibacterales bacterium]
MNRWEALIGIVNAAMLFMPVFLVIFFGPTAIREAKAARARRLAAYRRSPESRLLILND